jgi:hypothetical protein
MTARAHRQVPVMFPPGPEGSGLTKEASWR